MTSERYNPKKGTMTRRPSLVPRGPALVLGATGVVTVGAIIYSHYAQVRDRKLMRAGVERDRERLRLKQKLKKQMDASP